jgi:nicotinamidase-related amidase
VSNLNLDAKTTALVLIDLQNAIVSRDTAPYAARDVVARSAKLAEAVRGVGGTVVYVHVLLGEFAVSQNVDKARPQPATPLPPSASEIAPEAGMREGDVLIAKRQWGAFYATNMDQALRRRGVKTIVIGGIATNMGVESTARSAHEHGYDLVFAEDAMSSLSAEMHEFSVKNIFPMMGRVRSTEEILGALKAS